MLPPQLSRWSHLRYIKEVVPGAEWHAECPLCGDEGHTWRSRSDAPDRFHMHAPDRYVDAWHGKCRRCGYFAVADDGAEEWEPRSYLTPAEVERIQQEAAARREYAMQESERMRKKIEWLREEAFWQGYNRAMSDEERQIWRASGIPDDLQDRMGLGYVRDKASYVNGELIKVPALSIPYFDVGWDELNVQYRLLQGEKGGDKYRFTSGLRAPLYLADPDERPQGKVLVVEGAKKALVVYLHLVLKANRGDFHVVAFPSKMPNDYQVSWLSGADVVYLGLDPDANDLMEGGDTSYVERAVQIIGRQRTRIISWPEKPDDMLVAGRGDAATILSLIDMSRRA